MSKKYRIRQNIRGGKLSRFINNMHYVGKTFAVCSLEASARLAMRMLEHSIKYLWLECALKFARARVFRKLFNSVNNSVINSISCYNGLLFRQNLQIRMTLGRITQNCCHFLVGLRYGRTTQMLIQRTRRVRQRWTTFLDLKIRTLTTPC